MINKKDARTNKDEKEVDNEFLPNLRKASIVFIIEMHGYWSIASQSTVILFGTPIKHYIGQ